MRAYDIEIADSDYSYLVIAEDIKEAVTKLEEKVCNGEHVEITRIRKKGYDSSQIII